jgi:RNA polymerase sigma-70 factor (ECF subfamily)
VDDESQLVSAAAAGSPEAARRLFDRHWSPAWRLAYSLTRSRDAADDVAQDAFERAFRGLSAFDGRSSFRTWLFRILYNRAADLRRRNGSAPANETEVAPPGDTGERDVVRQHAVRSAVLALPPERRVVVALRYWGDQTPAEIAEVLDLPVGTVHSRLARALAELRQTLETVDVR